MIHRQAKFTEEDIENLKKFESSIEHWSTQVTKALIQADDMKATVRSIYLARQNLFERVYKEAGIDPALVQHAELSQDGTLNVFVSEPPTPEPASSEGVQPSDS